MDHLDCMKCQRIGVITVKRGNICLNCMRHRIHTGVGSQLLRHRLCQIRVNDCYIRRNIEISQRVLDALLVICDYAECRNLGCCAGGRRNRAEFRLCAQGREAERCNQILKLCIRILVECPHRLCCIDRGSAADCYDPVRTELLHQLRALHDRLYARIRLYSLKQSHFHAGLLQILLYSLQKTKALHGAAADYDNCLLALQVLQFFQRTCPVIKISR